MMFPIKTVSLIAFIITLEWHWKIYRVTTHDSLFRAFSRVFALVRFTDSKYNYMSKFRNDKIAKSAFIDVQTAVSQCFPRIRAIQHSWNFNIFVDYHSDCWFVVSKLYHLLLPINYNNIRTWI